jgi:hypothetical protein
LRLELLETRDLLAPTISTIAGNGTAGFGGDGGPAPSATLHNPADVAVDAGGDVFLADSANNRIRKLTPAGTISTLAGNGTAGFSGDGGPATSAALNSPFGVAVDAGGDVFLADYRNQRLRKVTPAGTISTFAGNGTQGFSGDGGPATGAQLNGPFGVAVDAGGDVFLAESGNQRIRKVTPAGTISTIAGNGTQGFSGDGGPATRAQLFNPEGIAVDASGDIFIADSGNNRLRKVTPAGAISTFAGTGTQGFSGDGGPATSAALNNPFGVAVDAGGDVFLGDSGNNRIREVTPAGTISTLAGNGTFGFSGDGGPATSAALAGPIGVAVDASGNVFIADTSNNRIRFVTPASPQIVVNAGNNQTAPAGTAVGTPPSVLVEDARGNAVPGVSVTFAVASGGGSVTGAAAVSNAAGVAAVGSWTLGTAAGPNTLTASAAGFAGSPLTFTATALPGAAAQLAFATQPSPVVPGQFISPAVTVLVEDAFGNLVPSDNSTVAVALGNNPGGATLGGTATAQAVNGRATFPRLNLSAFGSGYTLVARDGTLPALTSRPFDVAPITITPSHTVALVNQPVTFTVKVFAPVPGGGTPFGTVTLSLGTTILGTANVGRDGRALFTTSALPLAPGSGTTPNVITATYNDPVSASTMVTTVATSGAGVPITIVLGPGAAATGPGTLPDGASPGFLAGTFQTNSPLVGQFVPATDTLVPNFGDDNLFTLAAGSAPDTVNLLTAFTAQFAVRSSYTVMVQSDIHVSGLSPAAQVFTLVVIAPPRQAGNGGGIGHGGSTLAVFDPTGISNPLGAVWYLGTANGPGAAPTVVLYGGLRWQGVLGDWTGKGFDSLGVVDTTGLSNPGNAAWYLRNTDTPGGPDFAPFLYGLTSWTPVVGDWDGDGLTSVGAFDPATATWYLRNENSAGAPDAGVFPYGLPGWVPLAGDWTGSGHTGIGAFDPATATFYLRNSASPGAPDFVVPYGAPGWKPVVGDWDGNGTTTIGVVAPGSVWYIRNSNSPGAPDGTFPFGLDVWAPLSGRFTSPGTPERADGGRGRDPGPQVLTTEQLRGTVTAALARLRQAGIGPALLDRLAAADYEVSRLPGALLGVTTPDGRVLLSPNAAGYGWFVDPSPAGDADFQGGPGQAGTAVAGGAAGRMDLLTVLWHEMTHLAGRPDVPGGGHSADLRADTLAPGVRRLDGLDAIFASAPD